MSSIDLFWVINDLNQLLAHNLCSLQILNGSIWWFSVWYELILNHENHMNSFWVKKIIVNHDKIMKLRNGCYPPDKLPLPYECTQESFLRIWQYPFEKMIHIGTLFFTLFWMMCHLFDLVGKLKKTQKNNDNPISSVW